MIDWKEGGIGRKGKRFIFVVIQFISYFVQRTLLYAIQRASRHVIPRAGRTVIDDSYRLFLFTKDCRIDGIGTE